MAFRAFDIGPVGGLRKASATELPNLVVVAGPNGAGKSTLLHQLNTQRDLAEPGTRVTYLGPHRSWRKTQLGGSLLSEFQPHLTNYMEQLTIPPWRMFQPPTMQGVSAGQPRDPGGHDDVFSFVKASILKLDQRQQVILRDVWERQGRTVAPDDVPPLLQPLRALVRSLLPHLDLERIDSQDEANLRVMFRRVDGQDDALVEIDDLSSGEKSVIGLMLPLVEAQVETLINERPEDAAIPAFIVDEPENHLHSSLQVLLVEHLAELADKNQLQSIVATQSPTIVDALDDESLFLLAPVSAVSDGNQFVPIGRMQPRLEVMRSLTGSTHLLTRCRPIIYLEGEAPAAKPVSDQRLVEILIPEAKGWVLVTSGGRGSSVKAAGQLRDAAVQTLPGVPVFALVDRDQATAADNEYVIAWPVAMVENLLLDPDAIWSVLAPHREQITLAGVNEVRSELIQIARNLRADEVRLRVEALRQPIAARINARTEAEVTGALEAARSALNSVIDELASDDRITQQFSEAELAVSRLIDEGRELEAFRGKEILNAFFEAHVKQAIPGKKAFEYSVARETAAFPRLEQLTAEAVRRIERFVPSRLLELLAVIDADLGEGDVKDQVTGLLGEIREAREAWERDGQVESDFEHLRTETVRIAGLLPDGIEQRHDLGLAAAQLGVRSARA